MKKGEEPAESGDGDGASGDAAAGATAVLSPELMAELGDSSTGGAMISKKASNKGKKRGRVVSSETRELAASISKSKAKKLKQLEDKKAKDGRRAELYLKLEQNRMSQSQLSLLQSSKTISMNQDTLRSRIKQAVQRAVAGSALSDDAVKELESHPGAVADVEEVLALPVGGALAAARRSNGSGAAARGNSSGTDTAGGRERGAGAKVVAAGNAVGASRSGTVKAGGGNAGVRDVAAVGASPGEKKAADDVSSAKKRSRYAAVPVDPPKSKKRIQVVAPKPPKGGASAGGTRISVSGEGGGASDGERRSGLEENASGETKNTAEADPAAAAAAGKNTAQDNITADIEPVAATSGSSWAAKMMSSMARLPTRGSTAQWGALASSSAAGSTAAAESTGACADENGADKDAGVDGNDQEEEETQGSAEADGPAGATPAVPSYPPPPSWLEGNAPAYRAVETPLPSTSGGPSTVLAANRGGGGSSASLFPRPERWVPVKRSVALQAARMQLPVCGMEQEIMEAVHDNDTVILCGETGSGKSTQVPQFLYEAGYAAHGLVGVTQPRRVAAVGTAERVAVELGTRCGKGGAVAYQIRYDASGVGPRTRVKFMTDGVLLQEITSDLLLRKYSVVLLDEAHERNLNTDVLLGMLSRSIPLR